MKKTISGVIAAAAVVAALAGCGSSTGDADQGSTSQPQSQSRFTDDEQAYLAGLEYAVPDATSTPEQQQAAVESGHATCDALDAGNTVGEMFEAYMEVGNPELAGAVIGAATTVLCPEYEDEMLEWANSATYGGEWA